MSTPVQSTKTASIYRVFYARKRSPYVTNRYFVDKARADAEYQEMRDDGGFDVWRETLRESPEIAAIVLANHG